MAGRLGGKVAVVTGGGRGIGAAVARALAGEGAAVVCAARSEPEIAGTAAAIGRDGGRAHAVATDVADAAGVARLYDTAVERFGGIDLLYINAAVSLDKRRIEESDPADFARTLEVNVTGAYHCARLAIPHLRARGGGRMVLVGSGMGHSPQFGQAAYSCSKAAVWMLVRILADELRGDGIQVNELIPGPVRTAMTASNAAANAVVNNPVEWFKQPEDVVPLALFLATCPAPGPTGQSFSLMRRTL
jgi:3-oxoacyl-[acyl-carrier protein] reductase